MKVVKKVVKGVKKVVSGIVKGVKKVFKEITKSDIGKALLVAAVIFAGGAALGYWNAPGFMSGINGSLVSSTAAAGGDVAGAVIANASTGGIAPVAAATAAPLAPAAAVAPAAVNGASLAMPVAATTAAAVPSAAASGSGIAPIQPATSAPLKGASSAVVDSSRKSILEQLVSGTRTAASKVGGFVENHPYATTIGLSAASSMLTPDQQDLQENSWKREDDERKRREANLNVADIDIGGGYRGGSLNRLSSGRPLYNDSGLIDSYARRRTS